MARKIEALPAPDAIPQATLAMAELAGLLPPPLPLGTPSPPWPLHRLPPAALDGLAAKPGPRFAVAFLLAALRRTGQGWLGHPRFSKLARALGLAEADALKLLDQPPKPQAALGDPSFWFGRRIPVERRGKLVWAELFWRPDAKAWRRGAGAFALRITDPKAGLIEIRGRIDETRLDAVLHVERGLSRAHAADISFDLTDLLRRLSLSGGLQMGRPRDC